MRRSIPIAILVLAGSWLAPFGASAQSCPSTGVALQVLGANGPRIRPDHAAASASYLVWVDGQSRVLVDAGGGAFLRFAQAGGRFDHLALIAISHLHPDHVSDLPALLWGDFVRKTPLPIAGPSGNDNAPDFRTFLERLFDQQTGAFKVLGSTLGAPGRVAPLDVIIVNAAANEPAAVLDRGNVSVTAFGVPHGNIPTIAFRVSIGDRSIAFGTDQTGTDPRFVEFARGADLLVLHMTVDVGVNMPLHAAPDVVGRVARDAKPGRLILSHLNLEDLDAAVAEVKKFYAGPLTIGADLQCTPVP